VARRRLIAFAVLGIVAYVLAMVATMPASVFLKNQAWRSGIGGTVWNGEVGIAGGTRIAWHWAPLRSLTSLGYAADFRASGTDTDFGGRMLAQPGRVVLDKVSGTGNGSLLSMIRSDLPFTCDTVLQIEMERIELGSAAKMMQGVVTSDPGTCAPKYGGGPSAVPALILNADHVGDVTRFRLTPMARRRNVLLEATLRRDGMTTVSVTPAGAQALPFLGVPPTGLSNLQVPM